MGFKEVNDLDTNTTIALGGINKKTGKPNPKVAEGFFLGKKEVESKMARGGTCALYILKTADGNLGVWGKTDLDRKMAGVTPGFLVRMSFTGTQKIPGKNDMYKYKVEVDEDQSIEVSAPTNAAQDASAEDASFGAAEADFDTDDVAAEFEGADEEEDDTSDEVPVVRATPPKKPAAAPTADQQARVKALLAGRATKKSA